MNIWRQMSTSHSLNCTYWERVFRFNYRNNIIWNTNDLISILEIKNIILLLKNNKSPGPDRIPIEFYKSLFFNEEFEKDHPICS